MARCGSATSSARAASSCRRRWPSPTSRPSCRRCRWQAGGAPARHLAGHRLRRSRWRRLPASSSSTTARWAPRNATACARPSCGRRARPTRVLVLHGRRRFLVERHPPQRDRGGAKARPTSPGPTSTPWTIWPWPSCAATTQLTVAALRRQCRCRRLLPGAGRRFGLGARRRRSSIRITRTWAISTARNSGPTCCRPGSVPKGPRPSCATACR